jgi:predicted nucleic acid-binding protein
VIAGLIDTNIFLHAHADDSASAECQAFLRALEHGHFRARLEPIILHELSYALPRFIKQMTRQHVGAYLAMVLGWDGVQGERDVMANTVQRWRNTPGLSFADAYLAVSATRMECPVFTKTSATSLVRVSLFRFRSRLGPDLPSMRLARRTARVVVLRLVAPRRSSANRQLHRPRESMAAATSGGSWRAH